MLSFRIATPMAIHMFAWSNADVIKYISLLFGGCGVLSIVIGLVLKGIANR